LREIVVTLDMDWAPDFVIDEVANCLIEQGVRATWFVTHLSPAVERLRARQDLFELGIHPNFLDGSSHGKSCEEVLNHCETLVPEARSIRTHGLIHSSALTDALFENTDICIDSTFYLPYSTHIEAVEYQRFGKSIWRIPFFWEDDDEPERQNPCWDLPEILRGRSGLLVFAFHPIHVYLNSRTLDSYARLKKEGGPLNQLSDETARKFVSPGDGPKALFEELVRYLASSGRSSRLSDLIPRKVKP